MDRNAQGSSARRRGARLLAALALTTLTACVVDEDESSDAQINPEGIEEDAARRAPGSTDDPSGPCPLTFASAPAPLPATEGFYGALSWTAQGYAQLTGGEEGVAFQLTLLDERGQARVSPVDLWPGEVNPQLPTLATHGDALAIAFTASVGVNHRGACQLGIVSLTDGASIKPPTLISDAPSDADLLNDASSCTVARDDEGFIVIWVQMTKITSPISSTLFAQRVDLEGAPRGDRLTLAVLGERGVRQGLSMTWAGGALVTAYPGEAGQPMLAILEGDEARHVPLDLFETERAPVPKVAWVNQRLLARWSDQLVIIGLDGQLQAGPVQLDSRAEVVAFGEGYAIAHHDEFLSTWTVDATLERGSDPFGVSDDRGARLLALRGAPDGSAAGVFYTDAGGPRFAALTCGAGAPPPLGPLQCPEGVDAPLDDGCDDEVCHALLRFDYLTLGLLGYATLGGPHQPVDAEDARRRAGEIFAAHGDEYLYAESAEVGDVEAGVYEAWISPMDFGAVGWVARDSGLVLGAGGVVWMGGGSWWAPSAFSSAHDLTCSEAPVTADEVYVAARGCDGASGGEAPFEISDALDLALRTNLAATYAARGPFDAHATLYTPSVGMCDPGAAEFVVLLSQRR